MIVDPEFGLLPTGVFLALGLVLPVLLCFYIAFGFLEDSGYLPRFSLLLDKIFKKMGLNGKGVIPLVMGYSCITMAILTTRILDTKKERNIATMLLLLGTPCAPLLAVMLIVLDRMPFSATLTVFGIIFAQTFTAGWLLNKIAAGTRLVTADGNTSAQDSQASACFQDGLCQNIPFHERSRSYFHTGLAGCIHFRPYGRTGQAGNAGKPAGA